MIASYATPKVSPRNLGVRFTLDGESGSMLTTGLVVLLTRLVTGWVALRIVPAVWFRTLPVRFDVEFTMVPRRDVVLLTRSSAELARSVRMLVALRTAEAVCWRQERSGVLRFVAFATVPCASGT